MASVKAMTHAKAQLRKIIEDANAYASSLASDGVGTPTGCFPAVQKCVSGFVPPHGADGVLAQTLLARAAGPLLKLDASEGPSLSAITQAIAAEKSQLDSLSDLSTTESLRLQMIMDRRSKLEETLSNILKKMSDTASAIVANMK
jgi:hypothetical protein